jgi:hypothetical protein
MRSTSIILVLLLAACATEEQRADDTAAYIFANYGLVCEKLGYAPGSEKHRDCMVSMFNADEIRSATALRGTWGPPLRRR